MFQTLVRQTHVEAGENAWRLGSMFTTVNVILGTTGNSCPPGTNENLYKRRESTFIFCCQNYCLLIDSFFLIENTKGVFNKLQGM